MNIQTYDCIVIGTGAAGYNGAIRLKQFGVNVAIVTEGINCGTSRNTGSDKQTYYKLGLSGDSPDSVHKMAQNLFDGGCVDGDNALCEAALSARCFLHLCELGVPFPVNRYGEYVGYKTDHDPFARATSAGPLTSKFMTEALQKESERLGLTVYNGYLAIEILKNDDGVCGLIALERATGKLWAFRCANIILATGGPAGIYADSVYPESQSGSTSLALRAGAVLQNMTEWQYGLASVAPRWNVSGTYMQALPRFVSIDEAGNEYEFLSEYFADPYVALSNVFLKGYQWPFDSKKVPDGSSVIDLLVYRETVLRRRRVYLDFTKNPFGLNAIEFPKIAPEAYEYLLRAKACFGTPIKRPALMNQPAIDLYAQKGVDIEKEYLEIALCAQHNNGGIAVDLWWQTAVAGLFAVGECAGTHGVARPGGSALNAGQVGSLRAAQYIAESNRVLCADDTFDTVANEALARHMTLCDALLSTPDNVQQKLTQAKRRMSDCGAAIRDSARMLAAKSEIRIAKQSFSIATGVRSADLLYKAYQLYDILVVQEAVLAAMIDFARVANGTRGSALYCNKHGALREGLDELFRFAPESGATNTKIQEVCACNEDMQVRWRDVRPIPDGDDVFEVVWKQYRENGNIY